MASTTYYGLIKYKKKEVLYAVLFESEDNNLSLSFQGSWGGSSIIVEYSFDNITWITRTEGSITSSNGKIYLRGTGITALPSITLTSLDTVKISGQLACLFDWQTVKNGGTITMAQYACKNLFKDNVVISDASELVFPNIGGYGTYESMFANCTGLISAPQILPNEMGYATCLDMFNSCTNLINPPELPATTLGTGCYQNMFSWCTELKKCPKLPATDLAQQCYSSMFYRCTNLEQLPALPATLMDYARCYERMFYFCSKIKISETQTGEYTNAYRIPKTGTGVTVGSSLEGMFQLTGGTFKGTPTVNTTYYTSNTIVE